MNKQESVFSSVPDIKYNEAVPEINATEFVKVVESRRSVRVYDGTSIPLEIVKKCLDLALLAPNSSNLQMWEFYWVRSPEKKKAIVEACLSQPAASTAAEIIVSVARTKTWKKNSKQMLEVFESMDQELPPAVLAYYNKVVPLAYTMGPLGIFGFIKKILFFVVGLFRVVPREPTSFNDMKIWAVKSAALACENLMLSFRAFGYDTCPMEGLDSKRVKKILDLPSDAVVVMAISAGKRSDKGVYGPRIRFDKEQFVKEV